MGATHNKETFSDYLQLVGFDEIRANEIINRLAREAGTKRDFAMFREYLETKAPDPHLYDM